VPHQQYAELVASADDLVVEDRCRGCISQLRIRSSRTLSIATSAGWYA
jgi:hypothetical protein